MRWEILGCLQLQKLTLNNRMTLSRCLQFERHKKFVGDYILYYGGQMVDFKRSVWVILLTVNSGEHSASVTPGKIMAICLYITAIQLIISLKLIVAEVVFRFMRAHKRCHFTFIPRRAKDKTDLDVLRENHRFLWRDEDEEDMTWWST